MRSRATPIVGREDDARAALRALGEHRLVTIVGAPGVGKTRLARHLERSLARLGARVVAVELSDTTSERLAAVLARALGVSVRRGERRVVVSRIAEAIERTPEMVVVLDEAEHLAPELGELLDELVDATSAARFLVTSRQRLGVAAETLVELGPLSPGDATALFLAVLLRKAPKATVPDELATSIVLRLDRLPLAIELAAARAALLGASAVADELAHASGVPFRALESALASSVASLPPAARRALVRLATLRAPFTLAIATAVVGDGAVEALATLVEASLVEAREEGGGRAFSLLTLVRAFAVSLAGDEARAAALAHARYLVDLEAASVALDASRRREDWLLAFDVLCNEDVDAAQRLALALDPVLVSQGPPELHRAVLLRALALGGGAPRSALLRAQARYLALRGLHDEAATSAREALDAAASPIERGWAEAMLAYAVRALGEFDAARAAAERALAIARVSDELALEAMATQVLGLVDAAGSAHESALRRFEAAAALARAGRARRLEGICLANAAAVEVALERFADARRTIAEAREAFVEIGDRFHLARVALIEVELLRKTGALDAAAAAAASAKDEAEAQGSIEAEVECHLELGLLAHARGDERLARRALEAAELAVRATPDVELRKRIDALAATLAGAGRKTPTIKVSGDGSRLEISGESIDFRRRGSLRKVLVALVRGHRSAPGRALSVEALLAAAWPGERMRPESGAARVYMSIRRLRALGLEDVLVTRDDGYLLDPELVVVPLES